MIRSLIKQVVNTTSLILVLVVNYLSNNRIFNSQTVAEVSHKYETLFTPAGYAFSIWGIIYLLLISFVIFNWYVLLKNKSDHIINKIGIWFSLSNIANAAWVIAWTNEYIGLSVVIIFTLLFSLIQLVRNLDLEKTDPPASIIFFIWWPICIYFGWIILASIANVFAYFTSIMWDGLIFNQEIWVIIMIIISTIIYSLLIYKRNMREAAIVGVWSLIAIAYRQWQEHTGIVVVGILGALILSVYASFHAYKNRAASPIRKLKDKTKN